MGETSPRSARSTSPGEEVARRQPQPQQQPPLHHRPLRPLHHLQPRPVVTTTTTVAVAMGPTTMVVTYTTVDFQLPIVIIWFCLQFRQIHYMWCIISLRCKRQSNTKTDIDNSFSLDTMIF